MIQKVAPVAFETCLRPAISAKRSFHVETKDQYMAKHISLFLINLEITFNVIKIGDEWIFPFQVSEDAGPAVESFLSTIPASRPSSDELLMPFFYSCADAGRLDLAQSGHAVAQVASQGDTQYLADLWNAFAPASQVEVDEINPDPIPVPSTSTALDEARLLVCERFAKQIA